jgi:hypothetical protein
MNSLLITPESLDDLKLLQGLLKKLNISTKVITPTEREDLGLSRLMKEAQGSPTVSRASIMKKLGR